MAVVQRRPNQSAAKIAVAALMGGVSVGPPTCTHAKSCSAVKPRACSLQNTLQALSTPPQGHRLKSILASGSTTKGVKKSLRFNSNMPRHKRNPSSSSLRSDVENSFRRPEQLEPPCGFLRHCCDILVKGGALQKIPDALQGVSPSTSVMRVLDFDCRGLPTEGTLYDAAEYSAIVAFSVLEPMLTDTLTINVAVPLTGASSLGQVDLSEALLSTMLQLLLASATIKERFNRMHVTFDEDICTVTLIDSSGGYVECVKDYVHFVAEPRTTYDLMSRIHSELCSKVFYDDHSNYIPENNSIYELARWMSRHPISMAGFREIAREVYRQVKLLEDHRNLELLPYYFWHRLRTALVSEVENPKMVDVAAVRVLSPLSRITLDSEPLTQLRKIAEAEDELCTSESPSTLSDIKAESPSIVSGIKAVNTSESPGTLSSVKAVNTSESPSTLSSIKAVNTSESPSTLSSIKAVNTSESPSTLSGIKAESPSIVSGIKAESPNILSAVVKSSAKTLNSPVKPPKVLRCRRGPRVGSRPGYMKPTLSTLAKEKPTIAYTGARTAGSPINSSTCKVAGRSVPRFVTAFSPPAERRSQR